MMILLGRAMTSWIDVVSSESCSEEGCVCPLSMSNDIASLGHS